MRERIGFETRQQIGQIRHALHFGKRSFARDEGDAIDLAERFQFAFKLFGFLLAGVEREIHVHIRLGIDAARRCAHVGKGNVEPEWQRDGDADHEHRQQRHRRLREQAFDGASAGVAVRNEPGLHAVNFPWSSAMRRQFNRASPTSSCVASNTVTPT